MTDQPTDERQLHAELATARLAVSDWHTCATAEELERWRAAQQRLITAAQAITEYRAQAEHVRAVMRYTAKGYAAGENTDAKHWRTRAEEAEARCQAAEQARDGLQEQLIYWQTCEACGARMSAPGHCDAAAAELAAGEHSMWEDERRRTELAVAERDTLKAALAVVGQSVKDTLAYWEDIGFAVCDKDCDCLVEQVRRAVAALLTPTEGTPTP